MPAKIEGLRGLQKKLKALGSLEGGKVLRSAVTLATTPVVKRARQLIPVNDRDYLVKTYKGRAVAPGFAKRSIAKKNFLSRDKRRALSLVGVKPEAHYAVTFVERGTSKQPAQPWLRPAFRQSRREMISRFGKTIDRKIKAIAAKRGSG